MLEMQSDILASVPVDASNPTSGSNGGPGSYSLTYFLLWPLYMAGVIDLSSDKVRLWVIQRFRRIAEEVGIRQADMMADYLEAKKSIDPWKEMDARVVSWAPGAIGADAGERAGVAL